jgi:hypothetical protein
MKGGRSGRKTSESPLNFILDGINASSYHPGQDCSFLPSTNRPGETAMTTLLRRTAGALFLALPLLGLGTAAHAEYPDKPVRVIVPFGPGSVTDQLARILATHLSARLGQPFVVENSASAR